jgi:hypothetical protein
MTEESWLRNATPAFRLMVATSWLAPDAWRGCQEQAIQEAFEAGPDWTEYLRWVDRHRTPALSWAALKRTAGIELPENAKRELQKRSDASRMKAMGHAHQLALVLRAFNRAGIPVMPLKGPVLSSDLYGDIGLRHSIDLDVEIAQKDMLPSRARLKDLGYVLESTYFSMTPRQEKRFLLREYHLGFVPSQGGTLLEVHWRNQWDSSEQTESQWNRSIPSVWQGCSYRAMNLIDQVLLLCSHGGEHAWCRAKWLGDLARIYTDRIVDWEAVLSEAQRFDQQRPLLAALRLLKMLYGLPVPNLPESAWKGLHAFLIQEPLRHLAIIEEPKVRSTGAKLRDGIHKSRYDRHLWTNTTWRQSVAELAYHREDFRTLPLPDSLFWAYAPLRPVLWAWRKIWPGKLAEKS